MSLLTTLSPSTIAAFSVFNSVRLASIRALIDPMAGMVSARRFLSAWRGFNVPREHAEVIEAMVMGWEAI